MKNIVLLFAITLVVLAGCKEDAVNPPPTSTVYIHFQQGFLNDSVSVHIDGALVHTTLASTSDDSGFAGSFNKSLSTGRRSLSVRTLGSNARIDSSFDLGDVALYIAVAYSKVNGKLYLTYSTAPPTYRQRVLKQKFFFSSFRSGSAQNIFMMNLDGSNIVQLTHYTEGEFRGPRISPDGKRLLYYRFDGEDGSGTLQTGIYIKNTYDPDPENPLDYGTDPKFSPDGEEIVYTRGGIVKLRLSNLAFTRLTTNTVFPDRTFINIDWNPVYSPSGAQIAFNSLRPFSPTDTLRYSHWDLLIMDSDGTNQRFLVHILYQYCGVPTFTPTGDRIAFTRHTGVSEYYISTMRLTDSTWQDIVRAPNAPTTKAQYNPEGTRIYFQSGYPANALELYWVSTSGGSYQRITNNQVADTDPYVATAWVHE